MSEENANDAIMQEIEESLRRDQEENKNLPDRLVIDGLEFTNIRVRDIQLEPKLEENQEPEPELTENDPNPNQEPQVQIRDNYRTKEEHDDIMRQIEESMRRDQEENQKLPEKVVIDGLEFSNIRVREISLEPQLDDIQETEPESDSEPEKEQEPVPQPKQSTVQTKLLNNAKPRQVVAEPEIKSRSIPTPEDTKTTTKPISSEKNASLAQTNNQQQQKQQQQQQQQPAKSSAPPYIKYIIISGAIIVISYLISRSFK